MKVDIMHKITATIFDSDVGDFRKCDMVILAYAQYMNHMISYKNIKMF